MTLLKSSSVIKRTPKLLKVEMYLFIEELNTCNE